MNKSAGKTLDFLKVVRMVFWSGVVGPGTKLSLARSRFALGARRSALGARRSALGARTIALRAHCRATRSKARLVSKSSKTLDDHFAKKHRLDLI